MGKPITVGEMNGELEFLERGRLMIEYSNDGIYEARVLCHRCGQERTMRTSDFRRRLMCKDCSGIRGSKLRITHGASRRGTKDNPIYSAWKGMITRCTNPNTASWQWYGAAGITVCDEWQSFEAFRQWAWSNGYSPGLTIDRVDVKKGYSPDNCEYVTRSENSRRMMATYKRVPLDYTRPVVISYAYDEPAYGDY